MSEFLHFREAQADDRPALAELYRSSLDAAGWMPPSIKAGADFERDTQGERLFLVEEKGNIVGFLSVWEPESFIHHLYVSPACQGRGVGSLLLASLGTCLPPPWRLKCLCSNVRAHRFYQNRGWVEVEMAQSEAGPYRLMMWQGSVLPVTN